MIKSFFIISIIVVVLFLLYQVIVILGIGGFFSLPINEKKMEFLFENDKALLQSITDYFVVLDYEGIYIPNTIENGRMYVHKKVDDIGSDIKITDVEVIENISILRKKGYKVIGRNGNTIYFQRWSNSDNGRGVTYSIDGSTPTLQFLTKLEPLSEPNWYYYEEDYNEWRLRNQQDND